MIVVDDANVVVGGWCVVSREQSYKASLAFFREIITDFLDN